jgi:hypothetical protein
MQYTPSIVVCPHCDKDFIYTRVNGMALLEIAQNIEQRKRMRIRLTLDTLEREFNGAIPPAVKKAVLDGYNDLSRDIHTLLGFGVDAE